MSRKPRSRHLNADKLCAHCHERRRAEGYSYCRPCDRALKTASRRRCKAGAAQHVEDRPIPRDLPVAPRRKIYDPDERSIRHFCKRCGAEIDAVRTVCSFCEAIGEARLGI